MEAETSIVHRKSFVSHHEPNVAPISAPIISIHTCTRIDFYGFPLTPRPPPQLSVVCFPSTHYLIDPINSASAANQCMRPVGSCQFIYSHPAKDDLDS